MEHDELDGRYRSARAELVAVRAVHAVVRRRGDQRVAGMVYAGLEASARRYLAVGTLLAASEQLDDDGPTS